MAVIIRSIFNPYLYAWVFLLNLTLSVSLSGAAPIPEHADLTFSDYPAACLDCHEKEYTQMFNTTHYQWQGAAPDMVNQPGISQGKLINGVNSYCINILGNWDMCGICHAGRGQRPDDAGTSMENIDCLMCHNEEYAATGLSRDSF